jgi:hypothetical protein
MFLTRHTFGCMRIRTIPVAVAALLTVGAHNAYAAPGDQLTAGWNGSTIHVSDNMPGGVDNEIVVDVTGSQVAIYEGIPNSTIVESPDSPECAAFGNQLICDFSGAGGLPLDLRVTGDLGVGSDRVSGHPDMRFAELLLGPGDDVVNNGGGRADTIRGGSGNDTIRGAAGADHLYGDDGNDTLEGSSDDDTYDGGPGADTFAEFSNSGNDTINAQDGEADAKIDCGPGDGDVANVDSIDPTAQNCEAGAGGGGGPTHYTPANAPGVSAATGFEVPALEPRQRKGRWIFAKTKQLKRAIDDAHANLNVVSRPVGFKKVPDALQSRIDDGDILSLDPKPGTELTGTPTAPARLQVRWYSEAIDLNRQRCPYKKTKKLKLPGTDETLSRFLSGKSVADAQKVLKRFKCNWSVDRYVRSASAVEHTVKKAAIFFTRANGRRTYRVGLVVERPAVPDFTIELGPRPAQDWVDNPAYREDFEEEMGPDDYDVMTTSSGNQLDNSVLTVIPLVNATGMEVTKAKVELYDANGTRVRSTETGRAGAVTFTVPFLRPGTGHVYVEVQGNNGLVMEGWRHFRIVDRKKRPWMTADKRRFVYSSKVDGYVPAKSLPPDPLCVSQADAMAGVLRDLSSGLPSATEIVDRLNRASAGEKCLALHEVFERYGVAPAQLAIDNGRPVDVRPAANSGRAAVVQDVPTLVGRSNGTFLKGRFPAAAIAPGSSLAAVLIPARLIGNDAGSLIGPDGATLMGLPGGVLLGTDLAKLIGNDAGSLVGPDGATLVGNNGNTIRFSLADLIGDAGSGLRPAAAGGGIASTLAGPALLPPGGGFAVADVNQLIADVRSGIISDNGGGIISDNGGGLISDNGLGLLPAIRFGGVTG